MADKQPKKFNFGFKVGRTDAQMAELVGRVLSDEVNPQVASHGGFFKLEKVEEAVVYVSLGGGCQGCGQANQTLRQGLEKRLLQLLPEMAGLVDVTDHAKGQNPYHPSHQH